ncbi:protein of unknown function [Taphrina deformans PYCC 5710]|uniref:Lysosomal cobalamin transporter n=1 Tax=Taphrina deformans (strain PYCC 5710 / ATCC 11124 / CBS 356.35 / IMI 108563 / JCM 9778 / NBRC 8474) TaxID=1097556 RepID=R4XDM8_TAPDE|nr:protein of unknown function [Taphrina deformans PYCC 5710]|eukprot:CCG83940.1 protein of unknown function [Taphrina deformans PYCC 5710]
MWIILAAGFLAVSVAVLAFIAKVTKLNVIPAYVSLLAFVAFLIPTFTVVLLPIDLASGRADAVQDRESLPISYLDHTVLLKIWRASYWLSFSLTLTILPITQSFVESGYKEPWQRLVSSIRQNLRYQALYLLVGLFGVAYILLNTDLRSFSDFKSLLIALANTWGLFLAINFLGHGLVNIPRRIWRSADYKVQVRELEIRSSSVHEKLEDAITEELELASQVVALEKTTADKEWLEDMSNLIPAAVAKTRSTRSRNSSTWISMSRSQKDPTEAQMADLMNKIRNNKRERYTAEWNQLVSQYTYLLDCTNLNSEHVLHHRTFRSRLSPKLAYYYYVFGLPLVKKFVAICAALLSAAVLWAEILINEDEPFLRFVTFPITTWNIEIWSALLLAYMACCCYATLLRLKIFDRYALLDHGHTSQSSLFFYASYCCRVTIPLSYNFVTLLPQTFRDYSTFSQFLAKAIDLQPLGTAFNNWFPLYILLPVLLTLCNSYDRLKRTFGFAGSWIDDNDDDEIGSAAEGRDQLRSEISARYGELPNNSALRRIDHDARDHDNEDDGDTVPFLHSYTAYEEDEVNQSSQASHGMNSVWSNLRSQVNKTIGSAKDRLGEINRGRANPNIV